ncbi:MAG: NAD(P)-binding domain-containing protein [Roseitalea sp.]|jgi:predicted dinucleotide-binding enzyme|nr:NAD(P)-binding domain-containing protein [Roseitalea sp.]MBO6723039.1 NAD(P)-binding domain-containing protein [Roseitalea sp.]MBO6744077.1 NAD(P)-binding domain-containing protein [Roseitalea sp.]
MTIAIIGAGHVGQALAAGWARAGRDIVLGIRPDRSADGPPTDDAPSARQASPRDAAQAASTVVLALPWAAAETALRALGDLTDKTVIDCMNPIVRTPDGMGLAVGHTWSGAEQVGHTWSGAEQVGHTWSGAEQVAQWLPGANVVKTLNQVGAEVMADTSGFAMPPVMFMAGDDDAAKSIVAGLLTDLGFGPLDAGDLTKARLLEPHALVWINQALQRGKGRNWAFAAIDRDDAS